MSPEDAVRSYAEAKSRQDVAAALAVCSERFGIDTIPFGIASRDRDETAAQLALFFRVFPDYRAETEGMAVSGDQVSWWGRIRMTFAGELLGIAPTGRTADLPAFSVFDLDGQQLGRERFFFDLAMLSDAIGVPIDALRQALLPLQDHGRSAA